MFSRTDGNGNIAVINGVYAKNTKATIFRIVEGKREAVCDVSMENSVFDALYPYSAVGDDLKMIFEANKGNLKSNVVISHEIFDLKKDSDNKYSFGLDVKLEYSGDLTESFEDDIKFIKEIISKVSNDLSLENKTESNAQLSFFTKSIIVTFSIKEL